ncbi:MAG: hypothetical protein AMXMBFR84_33170 [Candidatus Hydrogenedentota bacterium]
MNELHALCSLGDVGYDRGATSYMTYVYLIVSESNPKQRYAGVTDNLEQRIIDHNAGRSSHTSKYIPWQLITYVAISDKEKAVAFERYFKSGSGHAFANKRLW